MKLTKSCPTAGKMGSAEGQYDGETTGKRVQGDAPLQAPLYADCSIQPGESWVHASAARSILRS